MFMLNTQLKVAYRAQQKAQIAESKANLAKRRFASYVFHEVRVPLNTASKHHKQAVWYSLLITCGLGGSACFPEYAIEHGI